MIKRKQRKSLIIARHTDYMIRAVVSKLSKANRPPSKLTTAPKETDIQAAICDYLAFRKAFFWRANTIPVFSEGRFRKMPKYSKTGVPDIILVKDGIFHGLEVKRSGGAITASQEAFKAGLEASGG